uniref:TerD family protein n=1 Tax=Streptomyces sp. NBC_00049 TaxID=2903617 RepID=A0AAU2JN84_9ACTN
MVNIDKGGNTVVPTQPVRIAVCHVRQAGAPAVDASALLLDARGAVRGDADLVFFNQPQHPSGAVRHLGASEGGGQLAEWLEVDLPRLEPAVERVVIASSADGGAFGQVPGLYVQVSAGEAVVATYRVQDASTETAFVLGELYRRGGEWKFRAVGQGYASGLAGLATDFGIAVKQPPPPAPPAPLPPAAPAYVPPPAPVYVPPTAPVYVPPAAPAYVPPAPAAYVPAAPKAHVPAPAAVPVPQPQAQHALLERSGHGDDVLTVEVPLPYGPVIVEAAVARDGYFGVHTLDRSNDEDELLFNTTVRDFHGRALAFAPGDRPLRLRVHADHQWTVRVLPVAAARPLAGAAQGVGPEVLLHPGPAADLRVRHEGDADGDGYFGVWTARPDLADIDDRELLVNKTGRVKSTVPLTAGPLLVLIEADGPWSAEVRALPRYR